MTTTLNRYTPRTHRKIEAPVVTPLVKNNAGGASYTIYLWQRLMRFLVIGSDGGTYYVSEKDHALDNITVVNDALKADYRRAIDMAVAVSEAGRAPKNDYAIYLLAVAASQPASSFYALLRLNQVCRTGTHLFQFVATVDRLRGWGPGLRKAVANWYLSKSPDDVAYQVLKYQQREGWSHRDLLRKSHPKTSNPYMNCVFQYVTKGREGILDAFAMPGILSAKITSDLYTDESITVDMIERFNLSREMVPTEMLTNAAVLRALAEKSPYTALMRNLGNLTRHGILNDHQTAVNVVNQLTDTQKIAKSRVHPMNVLTAHRTYAQGTGYRGGNSWQPMPQVVDALEFAFYESFKNVEPTNKRFLVGLDISGSMSSHWGDGILTAAEIAAALGMVVLRTEPWTKLMGFANTFIDLGITKADTLETSLSKTSRMNFGSTDCAQPMLYAMKNNLAVDCFVVITDNETWAGRVTPADALRQYRKTTGIDAKLIVLATESTRFSIADPKDRGMLDIVGFDSSVPEVIRLFVNGDI